MKLFDHKRHISMDLGAREIKIVEGKATKKNIFINNKINIELPKDIYFDGMILNIDQLSYYLRTALKENKITSNLVTLVINSSNIITREIVLPKVSDEEIESILKYQIEDYIPIEPEDYLFQHTHLGSVFEDGVEKLNLLLIAIPKTMVESHLNLIHNIGLKPYILDFQGNALNKLFYYNDALNGANSTKDHTIASIDMGYSNTKVNITLNGSLKVSRVINVGAAQWIKDIQMRMDMDEEEILNQIKDIEINEDDTEHSAMIQSLSNILGQILEGIDMVFKYYNTRDMGNKIDFILLQGGFSKINGLEDRYKDFFNMNTIKLHSLDKIKGNEDMGVYSNAIGGLIRLDEV